MPEFDLDSALAEAKELSCPSCGDRLAFTQVAPNTIDDATNRLEVEAHCFGCAEQLIVPYRFAGYTTVNPVLAHRLEQRGEGMSYFGCPVCDRMPETIDLRAVQLDGGARIMGAGSFLPKQWYNSLFCWDCGEYQERFEQEGTVRHA